MPFFMVRDDIVTMRTDAIVNAANSRLAPGGGVCGAIFAAAGDSRLAAECAALGGCPTGSAVLTKGYRLPAKYIIHAVGPIWRGGGNGEAEQLRSCYLRSLELASKARCKSVAFPLISAGIYGYPKAEALQIAVGAIRDYLRDHELTVWLVLFDRGAVEPGERRFSALRSYLDDHYRERKPDLHPPLGQAPAYYAAPMLDSVACEESCPMPEPMSAPMQAPDSAPMPKARAASRPGRTAAKRSLEEAVQHLDDSFSKLLFYMIDRRGLTDVEVYKRANLDRKLFSKLRRQDYQPSKQTAIALCIALRLSLDETRDLLARAGYALSPSSKFDVIIEYFIRNGEYDIFAINDALFAFEQKLLGA